VNPKSDYHLKNILFRDNLRESEILRTQYEEIKKQAIRLNKVTPIEYNDFKSDFIKRVTNSKC